MIICTTNFGASAIVVLTNLSRRDHTPGIIKMIINHGGGYRLSSSSSLTERPFDRVRRWGQHNASVPSPAQTPWLYPGTTLRWESGSIRPLTFDQHHNLQPEEALIMTTNPVQNVFGDMIGLQHARSP